MSALEQHGWSPQERKAFALDVLKLHDAKVGIWNAMERVEAIDAQDSSSIKPTWPREGE